MELKTLESKKEKDRKIIEYPKRPKRGEIIKKTIDVISNLRQINFKETHKGKHIMIYNILFEPEIKDDNNSLKKKILRQLKEDLVGIFEKYFLYSNTIFVCTKKSKDKIILETKVNDIEYKIIFNKILNNIDCSKIINKSKDDIKIKIFVENILKNIINANNHVIKFGDSSFFDYYDVESCPFKKKYKIWNGFSTNILISEKGLLLQINDKNMIITGMTAYEKMKEISKKYDNDIMNESCKKDIISFFKGKTLFTQYGNYRSYKIGDIDFDRNVENATFNIEEKDGKQRTISIKEYYQMKYKIIFKYDDQPLFIEENKNEKNIKYLIPELLYLTGNDEFDSKDKEEFFLMRRKVITPAEKLKKLNKGINYLIKEEKKKIIKNGENIELPSPNNIREEWGICFADNFLELKASLLPKPLIKFAEQDFEEVKIINGKFKIKKVLNPVNFDQKNCLLITFKNLVNIAKNDCEQITKSAQAFGLEFSLPQLYLLEKTTKNEIIQELEKIDFNNGKKMVMIVLDDNTRNLYSIIKDYIYSQAGIASQCILHDEKTKPGLNKFTMSYYSSVLNQMVVKAQGELFEIKFCDELIKELTMIMGIELSRIKDNIKYNISSSYNKSLSKYYNDSKKGNIKENPIDLLLYLIKNSLDYFKSKNNNKLPNNILIYREGGNDIDKILKNEIIEIEQFFKGNDKSYKKDYKPKLTIFNVNKKTNLKFYQKIESNIKSVPIGTCIDDQVIMSDIFEFYLQSMEFEKGTAIPVQYLCLFNNNDNITMTDFEKITFNQSYYRWNSNGPTRLPIALINAEEANRYCNKYLTHDVLPCLKNSPYFI